MKYEVWTNGIREGELLIATDDINKAADTKGNNTGSFFVNTDDVGVKGAVIKATETLKSQERVIVIQLKDGNKAIVEDLTGALHTVDFNNIRLE